MGTTAVLIMSEHNVSELVTVLHYVPDTLLVVSSQFIRNSGAVDRFSRVVNNERPEITIVHLPEGGARFEGNTFEDTQVFLQGHLIPQLRAAAARGDRVILNVTGGNKPQAALTLYCWDWDEVHYISNERGGLKIESFRWSMQGGLTDPQTRSLPSSPVSPYLHARLYNNDVKRRSPNVITQHPDSLNVAGQMLAWQNEPEGPWWALSRRLEALWFGSRGDRQATGVLRLEDFGGQASAVKAMLECLATLADGAVTMDHVQAVLPVSMAGRAGEWTRWVSGFWFEQWVEQQFRQMGFRGASIESNLQLAAGREASGRETDLVLEVRGRVKLLELKVDLPRGVAAGNVANDFKSNTSLGKADRWLLVCNGFRQRLSDEQWARFESKCHEDRIHLLVVLSAEDLRKVIR